jgi:3-mercaptopyruvate sulfurtransferase SseA
MSPTVTFVRRTVVSLLILALLHVVPTLANPSQYPQFAQHQVDPAIPIFFIGVKRVKADLDAGRPLVLVDVRSQGEYNTGHLPKARSMPLEEFPRRLAELPRDIPVVLY